MFITFEGVEGAGKSTQIARLASRLRTEWGSQDVLVTREPGDGPLGQELRAVVLNAAEGVVIHERAELLIMLADRAQHVAQIVRPHLENGGLVLCDRYGDSSVAYQGYGRGLDVARVEEFNAYATDGLQPDLTFLLDLDPEIGLARQSHKTRMELEALAFHQRVRRGFLDLSVRFPNRFRVIDASRSQDDVHCDLWDLLSARLQTV